MAKIKEHGKYWREPKQITNPNILVKCPECREMILVYKSDCFTRGLEAWCECGCKFIPESIDVVEA